MRRPRALVPTTNWQSAMASSRVPGHHRIVQNIPRRGRPPVGLLVGELPRLHQVQAGEPHVLHGPGHPADIARVAGIDQYNTDIVEIHADLAGENWGAKFSRFSR